VNGFTLALLGGGLTVVAGLIALSVALARRAENAKVRKEIADERAGAKQRADEAMARRVTKSDVADKLRDGKF
jgi:hypothetical protein